MISVAATALEPGLSGNRDNPKVFQTFPGRLSPQHSNTCILERWQYNMLVHKVLTKPITALHSTLNGVALMKVVSSGLIQLTFLLALSLQSLRLTIVEYQ